LLYKNTFKQILIASGVYDIIRTNILDKIQDVENFNKIEKIIDNIDLMLKYVDIRFNNTVYNS
jgi:hypothetical protein